MSNSVVSVRIHVLRFLSKCSACLGMSTRLVHASKCRHLRRTRLGVTVIGIPFGMSVEIFVTKIKMWC
jgi:hypothetical protein